MYLGPFEQTLFRGRGPIVFICKLSSIGPLVLEKMFENVDGQTPEAGALGIPLAQPGAFHSGELK